ncbi:hypothetical protein ASD8599_01733 [Ascidiaceihabitans donghaensis]|uniref:Uncharacterized protein n=1 Tax=Ascidiaceihabitans donghaensis TaxID=1510460 RepID=A0A2R8BD99_9RHOB|nr:capsid protein [Ascidiaceihabitans donghaensis]SPH20992.1 hypothetical protein ASD8599_01733 [Ascidiaceihabitans donghaensis]
MTRRPFAANAVLTAIAVNFANPASALIADQVMPRVPVGEEDFKWTEYPISEGFNTPDAKVGRLGRVKQLEFTGTERTASVDDYGLEVPIPYSDIDKAAKMRARNASAFDPEANAAERVTDTLQNIREVRVSGMVHNPDNYEADKKTALVGGAKFSDYANSSPIDVIKAAINGTLIYPGSTCAMSHNVWTTLSSHPDLVNAVRGNLTNKGMITPEEFVSLFSGEGLTALHIGRAYTNTSKPGQAAELQRAWRDHMSFMHLDPMASVQAGGVTWGLTGEYASRIAGRTEDPNIGLHGGYNIRVGERVKELIIAKQVGYLVQNCV